MNIQQIIDAYEDTPAKHQALYDALTAITHHTPLLMNHRQYIREYNFGYGDDAFYAMWKAIVESLPTHFSMLEIGVFCGQITSLVSILAQSMSKTERVIGITPLNTADGHPDIDYFQAIKTVYQNTGAVMDNFVILEAYSTQKEAIGLAGQLSPFDVVYIDGGHDYTTAFSDLDHYQYMVKVGGYLVVDDASNFLNNASCTFDKGVIGNGGSGTPTVSEALRDAEPELLKHYKHLFAVGHNRVYQRIEERKRLKYYAYHKGLSPERFDSGMTAAVVEELQKKHRVELELRNTSEQPTSYTNWINRFNIPHGSLTILENETTGNFFVSDFGDNCLDVVPLARFDKCVGLACGQYNRAALDKELIDPAHRNRVVPGFYPETNWENGIALYNTVQELRSHGTIKKLYFRGTVYPQLRDCVRLLSQKYPEKVNIAYGRIDFNSFIREAATHSMTLGMGLSPYHSDICFRDVEMFGLGIPVIRPELRIELHDPLIPNVHYIAVEANLDPYTLWTNDHETLANSIIARYNEVVDDIEFLEYITHNARSWYLRNVTRPGVVNNLLYKIMDVSSL